MAAERSSPAPMPAAAKAPRRDRLDAPKASGSTTSAPRREYQAAADRCGVARRTDRVLLRVSGRAPMRMLHGILTNRVPGPPTVADDPPGMLAGEGVYGAVLTAKGRMVADQKTLWLGASEAEGVGLDVSAAGHGAALAHFARFLPPRMARVEDLAGRAALLTAVGPEARATVAGAFGAVPESGFALMDGGPLAGGVLIARGLEQVASWDVWVGAEGAARAGRRLVEHGAALVGPEVWETLRVEAGFPRFGVDMDEKTIPVEAGLVDRAFDHEKGCYTGQEVIVRIRHRGRVNWRLRWLRFGCATVAPGDRLFMRGAEKACGRVTSAARSLRFGEVVGLGYVRREVDPPAVLSLGSGEGPPVQVETPAPERPSRPPCGPPRERRAPGRSR